MALTARSTHSAAKPHCSHPIPPLSGPRQRTREMMKISTRSVPGTPRNHASKYFMMLSSERIDGLTSLPGKTSPAMTRWKGEPTAAYPSQ